MIEAIKWVSLGVLGIVFYAFAGMMTYHYHETLYPGGHPNPKATLDDHRDHGHRPELNYSEIVGIVWPFGLPATLGVHAARLIK